MFNQAYPTQINTTSTNLTGSDIFLTLDTVCNVRTNVNNGAGNPAVSVCDPLGGFRYTDGRKAINGNPADRSDTLNNFGKIVNKHGRRIVEFAFKFNF